MISIDTIAWSVQFASCIYMAGVVSVIQFIHYPSFDKIDRDRFTEFHLKHSNALGFIAGPAMCLELVSSFWIAHNGNSWLILNATVVLFLWIITFLISVPLHNRLASGFDQKSWERLLKTNWLRTALWVLRGILFFVLLAQSLRFEFIS